MILSLNMPKSSHGIWSFLRKRKYLVVILLVITVLFIVYKSDKIMIEKPQEFAKYIQGRTGLDFYPLWYKITSRIFRFEDDLNPFRIKKNLLDGYLPIYSLELNPADLLHFDNLSKQAVQKGYLPPELNNWRKAKLSINGKEYKVSVQFHGDTPPHWSGNLKTYQIKTDKEEYINNMRKFNLIIFEDRLLKVKINRILAKQFGLFDIRDNIVVLEINGVVQGLYYLQEVLDVNFLEYNECSNCMIVKNRDNWVEDHPYNLGPYGAENNNGVIWGAGHRTPFDYELSNIDSDADTANPKALYSTYNLFRSVEEKNPDVIKYFDMDQLSSFEAYRILVGSSHFIAGDNLKMAYSLSNSKFYPIPFNEAFLNLKLEKGGIEHELNNYVVKYVDLFYILAKNDELMHLRNKKVYSFITDNTILEEYDNLVENYEPYAISYKTNGYATNPYDTRHLRYQLQETKGILKHNMEMIKKNLEYSKVYANIIQRGNMLAVEVVPDSIAEIKFDRLSVIPKDGYSGEITLNLVEGNAAKLSKSLKIEDKTSAIDLTPLVHEMYFSAGLDENLYPSLRKYRLEFSFTGADIVEVSGVEFNMRNDITNAEIANGDTYIQIADGNDYYKNSKYADVKEVMQKFPQFRWNYNNGELEILEGNYILDNDLIIPKIKNFALEPGVNIRIAENKSIISYSPAAVKGTKENPVVISALDRNKPFGAFAVVGDGTPEEKTTINWLDISNGHDKWINGIYFSGQLSIYHASNVYINNTIVHGSYSDDGLNIKYADVIVDNSKFYGNSADQIDFDFVKGTVKNSDFNGEGELSSNGDGLDLSGSMIIIKNNVFSNLQDKGISIGEDTKAILYKNVITNNNLGAAVKDLSSAYFIDNVFQNNKVAITAFQKKQLFGGAYAYVYKNSFKSNQKDFEKDDVSKIYKANNAAEKKLRDNAEKEILNFEIDAK